MGILSPIKHNKKIIPKYLKEYGFKKISWGRPDGYYKNGSCKWNKEHMCWEYVKSNINDYYNITIYFYPKNFNAFVNLSKLCISNSGDNINYPSEKFVVIIDDCFGYTKYINQFDAIYYEDIECVLTLAEYELEKILKSNK